MEGLKNKILYSALGASSGLTGLVSLARCSGAACTSCLGCAVPGIGILLITLFNKLKGEKRKNGMA